MFEKENSTAKSFDKDRKIVIQKRYMNDERYISNISADQICKRRAQVFMTDFLQNELHECNGKLTEINRMYSLL